MKILIVDDEKNIRESISKYLKLDGFEVIQAPDGLKGKQALEELYFDAAIIDLKMPELDGLALLQWIREFGPEIPVIMISAFGEIKDAVHAMKLGAKDYIVKPFDPEELLIRLKRIIAEKDLEKKTVKQQTIQPSILLNGESAIINEIKSIILKVSKAPSNILITGESGTGKEVAARMIHENSMRKKHPFIPINIGGIPENLLESELFGYEKGAFTGAISRKTGLFEAASGGTVFLDEIGDMPIHLQVKLLRSIQERKIQRLGSTVQIPVDIRILAATNRNLEKDIKEGIFREDLYYRLNVVRIHLPPLRERKEDIPEIAETFIEKYNQKFGKSIKSITAAAINKLIAYDYPGNIRELENIIERAFIFSQDDIIKPDDLSIPEHVQKETHESGTLSVKNAERETIVKALAKWDNNRTKAAIELGISRRTLINKIREYSLDC